MSTFLGIGAGPIQTGIFVSGAVGGGFSRIVLADVDAELVKAVKQSGRITVNTACDDSIRADTYEAIEVLNPAEPADRERLVRVAAEARAICTALPSTALYSHVSTWLTQAFRSAPERRRYIFAAENSTTAAEELCSQVGVFPDTYYLNTVIGKMSKVFTIGESDLPPLAPGFGRGHLVEAFNEIYTDCAPGVDTLGIKGLYPKADLCPFEEAKLYGHNTAHFALAVLLHERGCRYMDEAAGHSDLVELARNMLINECGAALCRKYAGRDPFFESITFRDFAGRLTGRMISPVLNDRVDRVIRDPHRKLGWNDRMIGAIRLCLDQGVSPLLLMDTTGIAACQCFGQGHAEVVKGLSRLWRDAPHDEADLLVNQIVSLGSGSIRKDTLYEDILGRV